MDKIKVVFWATPEFSAPSLKACIKNETIEVIAVITQPDRPQGRSSKAIPPPIKTLALKNHIDVLQPTDIKKARHIFRGLGNYDYNLVVAYGQIIPHWILALPNFTSINLHPSSLPRYRGPAPIQYALLHGDKKAGITIMEMDNELDHGPILSQEYVSISPHETSLSLLKKLSEAGAKLLIKTLLRYAKGNIKPLEQNHSEATYTKLLTKDDGYINWATPQNIIYARIRALNPWPGTYSIWNGKILKILEAKPISAKTLAPGQVALASNKIYIGTLDGDLEIKKIQLEGKKVQNAKEFIAGNQQLNRAILR